MPIYEYKCLSCGNQLEVMQKISDEALRECPNCQGKLEKQWSLSGFQFKGTGWYVSDYGKRGADAERSKAEGKAQNATDNGSETTAESKSEKIAGEKNASNDGDTPKTSSTVESTTGTSSASKPESKSAESKPIPKTD